MVPVFQEIPDIARALRGIKQVWKSGRILALAEFLLDPDFPGRSTTIRLCQRAGFVLDNSLSNL